MFDANTNTHNPTNIFIYYYTYGWIYQGLINISKTYNLNGKSFNFDSFSELDSIAALKVLVTEGPVMASIYYKFDPKSNMPHLIVIDGISRGVVYYNDPADSSGQKEISISDFEKGWKRKAIVIRPDKINMRNTV